MEAAVVAEAATDPPKAVVDAEKTAATPIRGGNRIHVSSNKKPVHFYVGLAKRIMQQHNEVVLSALGKAVGTVVKVAVILKSTGLATEKSILTSTFESKDESRGRNIQKAKIEILLGKTEKFDGLNNARKVDRREEPEDHKD